MYVCIVARLSVMQSRKRIHGGVFCLFGLFIIYLFICLLALGSWGEMEMGDGLNWIFAWREECFLRGNFGLGCRSTVWRGDRLTACVYAHVRG